MKSGIWLLFLEKSLKVNKCWGTFILDSRIYKLPGLNMLEHKTRLVCAKGGLLSGFLLLPTLQKTILNYYIQCVVLTMNPLNAWKGK